MGFYGEKDKKPEIAKNQIDPSALRELAALLPEMEGLDLEQAEDLLATKNAGEWVRRMKEALNNGEIDPKYKAEFEQGLPEMERAFWGNGSN